MRNKKLLKFSEITNIFDLRYKFEKYILSDDEINYVYNLLENHSIIEGIFNSYSTNSVKNILNRKFNNIYIEIESMNSIYIFDNILQNINDLKRYIKLFGWYIATIQEDENLPYMRYDDNINYNKIYSLSIEPTYDFKIDEKPSKLYHATLDKNIPSIIKNGLIPKTKSKIAYHPDRIYLTNDIKSCEIFKRYLEESYKKSAIILEIDSNGVDDLYSDVNWRENVFYVVNNISKNFIKVL